MLAFDSIDVTDRAIAAVNAKLGDGSVQPDGPRLPADPATVLPALPAPAADPGANPAPPAP